MKLEFDLELLELALTRAIELCFLEINLLSSKDNKEKLQKLFTEKEDLLEFFTWHQAIIVSYLKLHKNQLKDFISLGLRLQNLDQLAQEKIKAKIPLQNKVFGQDLVSSITIFPEEDSQEKVELVFLKDTKERPSRIGQLFKELIKSLENNFNTIQNKMEMKELEMNLLQKVAKELSVKTTTGYNRPGRNDKTYSGAFSVIIEDKA
jgi:hypothetical protein